MYNLLLHGAPSPQACVCIGLHRTSSSAIPPEVDIEKLKTKLTVNALFMTKSNEFGIGNTINCTQPAVTCSKLTIEALEQGVKYAQS